MATPSQPEIECSVCGGTGWKTVEFPGKASRAVRCECRINTRVERLLRTANMPSRYQHCTLSDFDIHFEGAHRYCAPGTRFVHSICTARAQIPVQVAADKNQNQNQKA